MTAAAAKVLFEGEAAQQETKGTFKYEASDGATQVSVYKKKAAGAAPAKVKITVVEA